MSKAILWTSSSLIRIWWYPDFQSNFVNTLTSLTHKVNHHMGDRKFIGNSNSIKSPIVNTKPPPTIFLFYYYKKATKWASVLSNGPCSIATTIFSISIFWCCGYLYGLIIGIFAPFFMIFAYSWSRLGDRHLGGWNKSWNSSKTALIP